MASVRLCFALLAVIVPAVAQLPDTVISINVNLVQIDAVAIDSNGNPVTDLKASDFEIRQDRKFQTITSFSFVPIRSLRRAATVQGPSVIPAVLKAEDVRRTIVFVVDDLALPFADLVRVRESLGKWVDQQMVTGDLVAVIRTSGGMGAFQRFSSDPRQVHAAIARLTFSLMKGPRMLTPLSDTR
jgi:VWFA-related protein